MKINKWLITLLVFICFISINIYGENISNSSIESFRPSIAVNKDGIILAVWLEAEPRTPKPIECGTIYYNVHDGNSWYGARSAKFNMSNSWTPLLDVDSEGNFHLAVADGSSSKNREIFYAKYTPGTGWSNAVMVYDSPHNSAWQKIHVKDDIIHIVWFHKNVDPYEGSDIVMISKSISESSWPVAYERISWHADETSIHPAFKVLDDMVYVCWMQGSPKDSPWKLYYKEGAIGSYWKGIQDQKLNNSTYYPELEVDDDKNVFIVFWNRSDQFYCQEVGKSTDIISTKYCPFQMGDIRYRNKTYVIAFTQETSTGIHAIHYAKKKDGENWEKPILLEDGEKANHPKIWMDNSSYAHFIWEDKGSGGWREIYYEKVLIPPSVPLLAVDISSLAFTFQEGSTVSSQSFNVSNIGGETLDYTITTNKDWLSVSPESGSLTFQQENQITAQIYTQNMYEGSYEGKITIASTNALNSPKEIDVSLTVTAPPIYAPMNFEGTIQENKALFYYEYIHHLTWTANPDNRNIEKYKLYEVDGVNRILLGEYSASTFEYTRRNVDNNKTYTYELEAVDTRGRTGDKATLIL